MVIEPRSQVALMREPRVFVAGRYFEWIACIVVWASIARASLACHARNDRAIHAVASMKCRFPVPWAGMKTERTPERAPAQARQSAQGVPERSLAQRVSIVW